MMEFVTCRSNTIGLNKNRQWSIDRLFSGGIELDSQITFRDFTLYCTLRKVIEMNLRIENKFVHVIFPCSMPQINLIDMTGL